MANRRASDLAIKWVSALRQFLRAEAEETRACCRASSEGREGRALPPLSPLSRVLGAACDFGLDLADRFVESDQLPLDSGLKEGRLERF
jgi:hypothetical protein